MGISMNNNTPPAVYRILVVDDNPSIHEDFRKILCAQSSKARNSVASLAAEIFDELSTDQTGGRFEMESAFQGQEALTKVEAAEIAGRPFAVAFVDVRMPPG